MTFQFDRLQAAANLIPILESGLYERKITLEIAVRMASFCAWAHDQTSDEVNTHEIAKYISDGLMRIEDSIASAEQKVR